MRRGIINLIIAYHSASVSVSASSSLSTGYNASEHAKWQRFHQKYFQSDYFQNFVKIIVIMTAHRRSNTSSSEVCGNGKTKNEADSVRERVEAM